MAVALVAAACGDADADDHLGADTGSATAEEEADGEARAGGEIIDGGTFVGDPPEHIDPALNTAVNAYQVVNAVFDGLTDIDSSDPENPVTKPLVAESFESNEEA